MEPCIPPCQDVIIPARDGQSIYVTCQFRCACPRVITKQAWLAELTEVHASPSEIRHFRDLWRDLWGRWGVG